MLQIVDDSDAGMITIKSDAKFDAESVKLAKDLIAFLYEQRQNDMVHLQALDAANEEDII